MFLLVSLVTSKQRSDLITPGGFVEVTKPVGVHDPPLYVVGRNVLNGLIKRQIFCRTDDQRNQMFCWTETH